MRASSDKTSCSASKESSLGRNHHAQSNQSIFGDNVPVDIELMFESIKWIDPSVYRMFCSEQETLSNLMYAMSSAYHFDKLESSGSIEIYNDYENEKIAIRRLTKYDGEVREL